MDDDIVDDSDLVALDRPRHSRPQNASSSENQKRVVQPKPQSIGQKSSASAILVSPRQKGNPVLNSIKSVGWEYSDIPADFVLGTTTCALFLSLKYHRLHPEYVYSRIKALGGRYGLRILLVMVDIENHEDPLKELSKTSLINNVTIILAWSSQEAGRYLELYKNYENAAPTNIKGIQSTSYSDQMVDFITVPRGINKTDAVSLVAAFGSIRTAMNAAPEEIALIGGWGEKKIQRWYQTVREPFRLKRAARRGLGRNDSTVTPTLSRDVTRDEVEHRQTPSRGTPLADQERSEEVATRLGIGRALPVERTPRDSENRNTVAEERPETRAAEESLFVGPGSDDEEALADVAKTTAHRQPQLHSSTGKRKADDEELSGGIAAALSKLRKT